jgi:hypothetical protein
MAGAVALLVLDASFSADTPSSTLIPFRFKPATNLHQNARLNL